MKFLEQFKTQAQHMFKGRYGSDQLNLFLLSLTLIGTFISFFVNSWILFLLSLIPLVLTYLRIFSKNITKRYQENRKFLERYNPIKCYVIKHFSRLKYFKTHKYLTCSSCKQSLRVPRGKGKICVTCPKCNAEMHIKS